MHVEVTKACCDRVWHAKQCIPDPFIELTNHAVQMLTLPARKIANLCTTNHTTAAGFSHHAELHSLLLHAQTTSSRNTWFLQQQAGQQQQRQQQEDPSAAHSLSSHRPWGIAGAQREPWLAVNALLLVAHKSQKAATQYNPQTSADVHPQQMCSRCCCCRTSLWVVRSQQQWEQPCTAD